MGEYQEEIQSLLSQVVGIAGHFGHWAPGMPIARGKGAPGLFDYVNRMAELQEHCLSLGSIGSSHRLGENERNNPKKRKKRKEKEFDTKHELAVSSPEKKLNGLVLKKVEFLDVPSYHFGRHGRRK